MKSSDIINLPLSSIYILFHTRIHDEAYVFLYYKFWQEQVRIIDYFIHEEMGYKP